MADDFENVADSLAQEYGTNTELIAILAQHPDAGTDPENEFIEHNKTLSSGTERILNISFLPSDQLSLPDGDAELYHAVLEDGQIHAYKTDRADIATALYLQFAEVTGHAESDIRDSFVQNHIGDQVLQDYRDWNTNLTTKDRRLRLLDLSEERLANPVFDTHLDTGSFRNSGAPPEHVQNKFFDVYEQLPAANLHPQKCYQNALNIMLLPDSRPKGMRYCEGSLLPRQAARPVPHAWIEIDGYPFEITYPWNRPDATGFTYFGSEIPMDEFDRAIGDALEAGGRDFPTPLSLSDEDREKIRDSPNNPDV